MRTIPGGGDLTSAAAPKKAATPEEIAASVYVAGVSPAVNEQTLKEFLECCGPLKTLTLTPTGLPPEHGRQYTAVYADAAAAQSALVLNSMTLVVRRRGAVHKSKNRLYKSKNPVDPTKA